MNWIRKRVKDKNDEKKRADLDRLAQLIEDEYHLAQMEADVLERQFDRDVPLVQCAVRLRDAFHTWHESYVKVLEAYNEFEFEKELYQTRRDSAIVSGCVFRKKELGNRKTKTPFLD